MTKRNATFRLVETVVGDQAKPGDARYWKAPDGAEGINFQCPCGCGSLLGVSFGNRGWTWNGNREKPTVRPSILHSSPGGCGWHGYLTDGQFVEC